MVIGDKVIDIDLLVRQILDDLRSDERGGSIPVRETPVPAPQKVEEKVPEVVAIHLTDRVVSLTAFQKAREENPTAKKVILSRGTILTPLAREAARKGAFELTFDSDAAISPKSPSAVEGGLSEINALKRGYSRASSSAAPTVAPMVLALHQLGLETLPKPLLSEIQLSGEVFQSPCLLETADKLEQAFVQGSFHRAVLLTTFTGAACAIMNRHRPLRALIGVSPEQMSREAAVFGANLLILNPKTTGLYQLRKMIQTFSQLGEPTVPKGLRAFFENE